MKRKTLFLLVMTLLCLFTITANAGKKNDIIKITFPNKLAVEIKGTNINKHEIDTFLISNNMVNFKKLTERTNVNEIINSGAKQFQVNYIEGEIGYDKNEGGAYELVIKNREIPNRIVSSKDFKQNLYYTQEHCFVFSDEEYKYSILFDNLKQLEIICSDEFIHVIQSIMKIYLGQETKNLIEDYYVVDQFDKYEKVFERNNRTNQQLSLDGGLGIQILSDEWQGNFALDLCYSSEKKGIKKHSYLLIYDCVFGFNDVDGRIYNFLGVGYRHDFSNDLLHSNAYTFKLQYLVKSYPNGALKFGVQRMLSKFICVEPQFLFFDGITSVEPSIKFGIYF